MLKTENPKNAAKALKAFKLQHGTIGTRNTACIFEHGQLWIIDNTTDAIWSVVDAEGGHSINGFDFEMIQDGSEY